MAEQELNRAQRRRVQKPARKARKKPPCHKRPYLRLPIDRPPATSDVMRKLQAAADKDPNQEGKPVWLHPECLEKLDQTAESEESQENT